LSLYCDFIIYIFLILIIFSDVKLWVGVIQTFVVAVTVSQQTGPIHEILTRVYLAVSAEATNTWDPHNLIEIMH
jgi:hypothetical protein